ncbi:MAG: type IV pilus modification protein PilV [Burkholderiales bacterium]|nr:MAG: type IV pilus modification protein PilV [Burkholderiales bacterium]
MIEVLITMVVLAFGLLGAAGLQTKMIADDHESYQRAQALLLLEDMRDRISANRADAASYVTAGPLGTGDGIADCTGAATIAARDLCEWSTALQGAAEQAGTSNVGAMVGARGCVEQIGAAPDTYRVTVVWQGLTNLAVPALPCGAGLFGADGYRRTVSTRVAVADLT